MTFTGWLVFFLIIQVIHFLGTWKLYVKAGRKAWEAIVPVYNAIVLMKIINRPRWWTILLFLPIINLLMFPVIWIETIRSFGFTKRLDSFLVIVTLGFYLFYINYATDAVYVEDRKLEARSPLGEWVSSIAFAIIAATLVHTYFMQPYTIPSSSLEKSLYVGDFLLVSKFHYGARVPMTTIAAPMVHDTIPAIPVPFTKNKLSKKFKSYVFDDDVTKKKSSFWNKFQLPYMRMPGFQKIKRNDIVVFNQPADTLKDMNEFRPDRNYYKPIDKKTNLVKRCVAIAGDTLQIIDGYVYINGKRSELPDRARTQYNFIVNTEGKTINNASLVKRYGVREGGQMQDGNYYLTLTDEEAARIANNPNVKSVTKQLQPKGVGGDVFPRSANLDWNNDNYGPLYIPKKGATVALNRETLPFYKRLISEYERNDLIANGDEIFINGQQVNSYTFKQDYFWMMGDNRQNSLDARYWGYVPFDHVVGKPVFIWLSWETNGKGADKIRWDRMFTMVDGSGEATSMFVPFLVLLIGFILFNKWFKKNKTIFSAKISDSNATYASIQDRVKAVFIDSVILVIVMYITSQLFASYGSVSNVVKIIASVIIFLLYDPLLTSLNGGTIGHSLVKIGVRKEKELDKRISFPVAIVRFLLKAILGWVSLLTISGGNKKKAIHDITAKSVVVKLGK